MPMLSRNLEKTLRRALALANGRQHEYATLEHLLMALTDDEDTVPVLEACAVAVDRLRANLNDFLDHELTSLVIEGEVDAKPTAGFQRVIQRAAINIQSSGRSEVSGANVLVALFSERESHAVFFLQEQNMSRLDAVNYISHGIAKRPETSARRGARGTASSTDWSIVQSGEARAFYGAGLEQILARTQALAAARQHTYATLDHLLITLTDDDSAAAVLKACAVEVDRLRVTLDDVVHHKLAGLAGEGTVEPRPTLGLQRVLLHAAIDARRSQSGEATGADVLMALFSERGAQVRQGVIDAHYKVLLLNDDAAPTEFVVDVLERFFGKSREDAARTMLHVHSDGVGHCGIYAFEIAETKVSQVMDFARQHQHPLRCTMERD